MKIYDTPLHTKVDFEPLEPGHIRMYVCGPTVYNYIHVGNARTFISFDMIRRYFLWRGYQVDFVQNVTDVDDKIIARSLEEKRTAEEVAREYTDAFIHDMRAVNIMDPTVRPKATEEIDTMIALVQRLIDEGHAYATEEGDVYFKVRSYDGYGQLSGRNVDEMEAGHRDLRTEGIGDRKSDPLDFALWKSAKPGEPSWTSPWGEGRPGWHIECSCMSEKYLGLPFDIHGGGADLCFPHHENERAQSEAATGKTFANHWMHGGMLQIDSEKMSKSLGNFLLLRDVLEQVDPNVLRFLMLQTHYRSPLDYSADRLDEAATALERLRNTVTTLRWAADHASGEEDILSNEEADKAIGKLREDFTDAMDDDFNSPKALAALFDYASGVNSLISGKTLSSQDAPNAQKLADVLVELLGVLGLDIDSLFQEEDIEYPQEVIEVARDLALYEGTDVQEALQALLDIRARARAEKDWALSDKVRDDLADIGLVIKDTPQGAQVEIVR